MVNNSYTSIVPTFFFSPYTEVSLLCVDTHRGNRFYEYPDMIKSKPWGEFSEEEKNIMIFYCDFDKYIVLSITREWLENYDDFIETKVMVKPDHWMNDDYIIYIATINMTGFVFNTETITISAEVYESYTTGETKNSTKYFGKFMKKILHEPYMNTYDQKAMQISNYRNKYKHEVGHEMQHLYNNNVSINQIEYKLYTLELMFHYFANKSVRNCYNSSLWLFKFIWWAKNTIDCISYEHDTIFGMACVNYNNLRGILFCASCYYDIDYHKCCNFQKATCQTIVMKLEFYMAISENLNIFLKKI
jgi:hypothetical protein